MGSAFQGEESAYSVALHDMDLDFLLRRLTAIPPLRRLWAKYQLGPLAVRLRHDAVERPWYAFGIHQSAALAKKLGLTAISAIEFGVAGGSGLLVMERLAEAIGRELKIRVATFGFDSGAGMPKPVDYRDLPHVWGEGYYPMDLDKLRARLTSAKLFIGDVLETVPEAVASGAMPPVGFVAFDLDYYSSTKAAFQIFEGPTWSRLPRVYCYFDDICFPEFGCHNEYVGELLAIREFNEEHEKRKICHIAHLNTQRQRPAAWNEQVFVCHDFAHPLYTVNVSPQNLEFRHMPLPR
jgi:hypothetical protein